jgi:outer membrane lipoprotein-sorting protein
MSECRRSLYRLLLIVAFLPVPALAALPAGVTKVASVEGVDEYRLANGLQVLLYVDAGTSQVRRVLILDAQGNRNRFDFNTPLVNTPIPSGEFTFTPPEGTQIVRP